MFLCETKSSTNLLQFLKIQLGFDEMFSVDVLGQSSGLCLLWKEECNICVLSSSRSYINAKIGGIGDPDHWKFTRFYDSPSQKNKSQSWNLMCQISSASSLMWVVGGDFNELFHSGKKMGGAVRPMN